MGCAWLAVLIGSPGATASAAPTWEGTAVVTSDYVFRGVSQTDGTAAAQADLHVRSDGGWFAGLWTSTVDPPPGDVASYEVDLYAGRSWAVVDRWVASVDYTHYMYPNTPARHQYDSDEVSVSARFDDRIALTATYSPNAIRYASGGWSPRARMLAYELSLRQPLAGPVALVGGIGYYDTRALLDAAYVAWNLGLSAQAGAFDFTLMRFGVNATARSLFGYDAADQRWVVTASWHF